MIYHPDRYQIWLSDREFSRSSIAERRQAGYSDLREALRQAPWFAPSASPEQAGAVIHACQRGQVTSRMPMPLVQPVRVPALIGQGR